MAKNFKVTYDRFHGVSIDCTQQTFTSDAEFITNLKEAILEWKQLGKRGLWVKIPRDLSSLIPLLTNLNFDFHHAQPGYVKMTYWMSEDHLNHLPEYANQYIGVGGFVVNAENKLLVMKERYYGEHQNESAWKLPGGHADKGEDLADTARREVYEETGIKSEFVSLLAMRQQHNYRYGCSDIYFVCIMRPLTTDIHPCPLEVADCCWMDIDEYIRDESISHANRHFAQCYKEGLKHKDYLVLPTKVPSFDGKKMHKIYSLVHGTTTPEYKPLPSESGVDAANLPVVK